MISNAQRALKADAQPAEGGVRAAYLDGWDTAVLGGKLFAGMRRYRGIPNGNALETAFIKGYHDADSEAT